MSDNKDFFNSFDFSLLDDEEFKEDSVREELILPILKKLGYSSSGLNRIIRSKNLDHPFVATGSGRRLIKIIPDYLLEVDKKYAWVLDAKSPNEDIISGENKEQAYFYAIHPDIRVKIYALCNGREFVAFQIDRSEPLIHFHLSEIKKHWSKLLNLLSPEAFKKKTKRDEIRQNGRPTFDYMSRKPLPEIPVRKQAAKRHFGVHGYFTRQVWNVVQEYIKNFSQPGDTVLDPFGGSGITLIESLVLGRKAIHIDLNPLSEFIVSALISPVSLIELQEEFEEIREEFDKKAPETDEDIKKALKKYSYPKGFKLPRGSNVEFLEDIFCDKQKAQLAYLRYLIVKRVKDKQIRKALLLPFSSTISKINLTYHPSKSRGDNAGNCAPFIYYTYRIAPNPIDLDILTTYEYKFKRFLAAKKDIEPYINKETINNAKVLKGTATNLNWIENESIDYIYTDPPYGKKIPYLDLSVMWNAWLDLPVTEEDYEEEAIEGGKHEKSQEEYSELLSKSIQEMYRVLRFDRWMSFVFAHKNPFYWNVIIRTAEQTGFEYAGAVKQNNGQTSFKKRQNPFTVLSGQIIINFRKVSNPKSIMRVKLGVDISDIVIETIEGAIAKHDGARIEEINDELIIRGLEMGFIDVLSKEYSDLTPLLTNNFEYNEQTQKYHMKKNRKFKVQIDVHLRIRYYLISYMRRCEHQGHYPSFDDIILTIMPLLKNGETPKDQTILNVLEEVAVKIGKDSWKLKPEGEFTLL